MSTKTAIPESPASHLDKIEAAEARLRLLRGESVTKAQKAALRKVEKAEAVTHRELVFRSLTKTEYSRMCGRQVKTINEQATRYGLPIGGPKIDLYELLRALHDFLQRNAHKLAERTADPLLAGDSSPALERYREERATLAMLDRMEREGSLIPDEFVHGFLQLLAAALRRFGHDLQVRFGRDALEMYESTMDQVDRETHKFLDSLKSKTLKVPCDGSEGEAAAIERPTFHAEPGAQDVPRSQSEAGTREPIEER